MTIAELKEYKEECKKSIAEYVLVSKVLSQQELVESLPPDLRKDEEETLGKLMVRLDEFINKNS